MDVTGVDVGKDHPRGCGEHLTTDGTSGVAGGSSPRMRGALPAETYRRQKYGIIPADAGSTAYHLRIAGQCPDHPRGCGEHPVVNC